MGEIELIWVDHSSWDKHQQTTSLPKFSTKLKHWYCYFTLNKNQVWTADIEGLDKDALGLPKSALCVFTAALCLGLT